MFFEDQRLQFFKPLTNKYRARVVECLRLLYQRLYSANADYGESLRREQVIEIFEEALIRAPELEADESEGEKRFKNQREQATWILNTLIEHGWIEKQVDAATLQSTYPFSRMGRLFTQPLVEVDRTGVRTRHRNTRNTLNALEAFLNRSEVHDLLDAYEYSERIISDFTDVIAELEEKKRELVREVEAQVLVQQATDQFFDFMEKRFQPDLSIRLSADSVEKHRDAIQGAIAKVRRKRKDFKADAERKLRQLVPELVVEGQSVLWTILDVIELRMKNAADIMLPALRKALQSFTKRADIIIRQLSYLHTQQNNDVVSVCNQLAELPEEEFVAKLEEAGEALSSVNVGLIDPEQNRLQNRRVKQVLQTQVEEFAELDDDSKRQVMVQQLLDQAFTVNSETLREYVAAALNQGQRISTADLPVSNAYDLLALAHAIEVGAVNSLSTDYRFVIQPTNERVTDSKYYKNYDKFYIELVKNDVDS